MSNSRKTKNLLLIALPALIAGAFALVTTFINKEPNENDFAKSEYEEQIEFIQDKIIDLRKHQPNFDVNKVFNLDQPKIKYDSTLSDLYINANPSLLDFINQGLTNIQLEKRRTLGYMVAGGGAGKSTFFKETWNYSEKFNNGRTRFYYINDSILLRTEDLKLWFEDFDSEPDLVSLDGEKVINTLPGTKNAVNTIFLRLKDTIIQNSRRQIFVFDGLDEISSSAAKELLRRVDDFMENKSSKYPITLIIVGRPEGFKQYFRSRRPLEGVDFELIKFVPPSYLTESRVMVRYDNLVEYRRKSTGEESPGINHVFDVLNKHNFLIHDFSTLMLSNPIITYSEAWKNETEFNIMEMLYGVIMTRNSETHARPPKGDDLYRIALENSILFKLTLLNEKGVFYVDPNESVDYGERKVNVRTLLNRSGLIVFDPADKDQFKFNPSWIPAFLLERRLSELKK